VKYRRAHNLLELRQVGAQVAFDRGDTLFQRARSQRLFRVVPGGDEVAKKEGFAWFVDASKGRVSGRLLWRTVISPCFAQFQRQAHNVYLISSNYINNGWIINPSASFSVLRSCFVAHPGEERIYFMCYLCILFDQENAHAIIGTAGRD
jgi:hypothetical protein